MEGEDEDEDMVGQRLQVAVKGMERVRREGSGNYTTEKAQRKSEGVAYMCSKTKIHTNPLVMRFVQPLVEHGKMLPTVDPVNTVIREDQIAVNEKVRILTSSEAGNDSQ